MNSQGSETAIAQEDHLRKLATCGYTVIPGLLSPERTSALAAVAERTWRDRDASSQGFLQAFDLFALDEAFIDLLDVPPVTGIVDSVLGGNVSVYHSHLTGTGHNTDDPTRYPYRWHQDAKAIVADLGRTGWPPCVSVKAGFFLTSVTRADHGATVFRPGSHLEAATSDHLDQPALGNAGSCVLFDNRIWHSRGPNISSQVRFCAYVAYGYRWLQNRDTWRGASPAVSESELTSRQRFLLGLADSPRDRHARRSFHSEAR